MRTILAVVLSMLASLAFCATGRADAREITVTDVSVSPRAVRQCAVVELEINHGLRISGIITEGTGEAVSFTMPRRVSKNGRVFPQVRLLTPQAQAAVRQSITGGKPSTAAVPLQYRITRCRPFKPSSRLRGVAAIVFNDAVEVEVTVAEGRNGYWVLWPRGRKRARTVTVTDKRLREAIEQDVLEQFYEMRAEGVVPRR